MRLWISGYRAYELNLFSYTDQKAQFLQQFFYARMKEQVEQGVDWFLFKGQTGVEYLAFQAGLQLKEVYPELQLAVFWPFLHYGQQWSETNQSLLQCYRQQADYWNITSHKEYENPEQLKQQENFLLTHSEGLLCLYDAEVPGSIAYTYQRACRYQEQNKDYKILAYPLEEVQTFIDEKLQEEEFF